MGTIKNFTLHRIFFSLFLFLSSILQAQSDSQRYGFDKDSTKIISTNLFNSYQPAELFRYNQSMLLRNDIVSFFPKGNLFKPTGASHITPVFIQQRTVNALPGLGTSEWLNNRAFFRAGENVTLGFEGGLAIQNTVLNPWVPNYQFTLGVSINFEINNHLDAYVFGQFISAPLGKPKDYFDPMMYNNPLFLQSGTGAGLKSNIKNTRVDFQIMSVYDKQLNNMNSFNSKLKIEF